MFGWPCMQVIAKKNPAEEEEEIDAKLAKIDAVLKAILEVAQVE